MCGLRVRKYCMKGGVGFTQLGGVDGWVLKMIWRGERRKEKKKCADENDNDCRAGAQETRWKEAGEVADMFMMGIIDGHYCPLSTVRSSVLFHYRADVLLGLFHPLYFREVRYSCASTQRVLVFYLPNTQLRFNAETVKEKIKSRSIRDNCRT